jgi:hypothetical protein
MHGNESLRGVQLLLSKDSDMSKKFLIPHFFYLDPYIYRVIINKAWKRNSIQLYIITITNTKLNKKFVINTFILNAYRTFAFIVNNNETRNYDNSISTMELHCLWISINLHF